MMTKVKIRSAKERTGIDLPRPDTRVCTHESRAHRSWIHRRQLVLHNCIWILDVFETTESYKSCFFPSIIVGKVVHITSRKEARTVNRLPKNRNESRWRGSNLRYSR